MGNSTALKLICSEINDHKFVKTLILDGQHIDDIGVQRIIEMLKQNESINFLSLSFEFAF